jgi:molybdate transport system substrate-binding protein
MKFPTIISLVLLTASPVSADTVTVAVASNFANTAELLVTAYEREAGHSVRLVRGSSGKLYAQILNAAPFDVFLSADSERPARLEHEKKALVGHRFTYAVGQLVVWSRDPALLGQDCLDALKTTRYRKVAIANPDLAPYGSAAKEFLVSVRLWDALQSELVLGENIAQTFQFVASGNATLGLIARSQLLVSGAPKGSCEFAVPPETHTRIEQQATLLSRAANNHGAIGFLQFLRSKTASSIISAQGYIVPAVVN